MPFYDYPRPALTVDVALFAGAEGSREVLLIRRAREPFLGMWALPGGFVDEGEPLERAARRELAEETGLAPDVPLTQIAAFGDPGRDPRGWLVTVAFGAFLGEAGPEARAGDDAAEAAWHPLASLPPLAADHADIVRAAVQRLGL